MFLTAIRSKYSEKNKKLIWIEGILHNLIIVLNIYISYVFLHHTALSIIEKCID